MTIRQVYALQCDECGITQHTPKVFAISEAATWEAAKNAGWTKASHMTGDRHYCPECQELMNDR